MMRPIKEISQATHFKRVMKKTFKEELKAKGEEFLDYEEEKEKEDLKASVWIPVNLEESKDEKLKDPDVKEIDLAAISEKEIYVRRANIVRIYEFH